jgi:hypothetical protein
LDLADTALPRNQFFCFLPQKGLSILCPRVAVDAEVACKDALNISIKNRAILTISEHGDGSGGGSANAWKLLNEFKVVWKYTVVLANDHLCSPM